ncbi:hydroxymethylbilane synthase [Pseudoclavibacter endophyticus]|uniref:hydroxymethylbilane synthase n=1 Tax=Pseudoclavibacter endophyticus TaxID=1778590 RepID=UPI001CE44AC4|nr:hydroxymethylbilane synthase [Pseudoclavibacter endophyticus]
MSAGANVSIRIGTRGSALAVAQTSTVADRLGDLAGRDTELVRVTTHGDVSRASLSSLGGTGVFAAELRSTLLEGGCDVAVHSLKDLPTAPAGGLEIAAYPPREDARDALCSAGGGAGSRLSELPAGAKVGTGSPRRAAQLRVRRPDLDVRDIRGNIETRLRFVTDGELDAVVLACAGLDRLGLAGVITERFELDEWPTAPGQGCLAVEVRAGEAIAGVADLDDPATRAAVTAERLVLAALEAGCAAPVGATARLANGELRCSASVYAVDGSNVLTASASRSVDGENAALAAAVTLASEVSEALLAQGAADLVASA